MIFLADSLYDELISLMRRLISKLLPKTAAGWVTNHWKPDCFAWRGVWARKHQYLLAAF